MDILIEGRISINLIKLFPNIIDMQAEIIFGFVVGYNRIMSATPFKSKFIRIKVSHVLVSLIILLVGCTSSPTPPAPNSILIASQAAFPYVMSWMEAFRQAYPDQPPIIVIQKPSEVAWQSLDQGLAQGVVQFDDPAAQYQTHSLGWTSLAIIASQNQKGAALSRSNVKDLFLGHQNVPGHPTANVYVYSSESDLQRQFNRMALGGSNPFPGATAIPGAWVLRDVLSNDSVGFGFITCIDIPQNVTVIPVDRQLPNYESTMTGKYPFRIPILISTKSDAPASVSDFIGWAQSLDGQSVLFRNCPTGGTS